MAAEDQLMPRFQPSALSIALVVSIAACSSDGGKKSDASGSGDASGSTQLDARDAGGDTGASDTAGSDAAATDGATTDGASTDAAPGPVGLAGWWKFEETTGMVLRRTAPAMA
jgi:hypothetical protein